MSRRLALALGNHRTDMHQTSKRPCGTCRYSKTVLDEYLAAIAIELESVTTPHGAAVSQDS